MDRFHKKLRDWSIFFWNHCWFGYVLWDAEWFCYLAAESETQIIIHHLSTRRCKTTYRETNPRSPPLKISWTCDFKRDSIFMACIFSRSFTGWFCFFGDSLKARFTERIFSPWTIWRDQSLLLCKKCLRIFSIRQWTLWSKDVDFVSKMKVMYSKNRHLLSRLQLSITNPLIWTFVIEWYSCILENILHVIVILLLSRNPGHPACIVELHGSTQKRSNLATHS